MVSKVRVCYPGTHIFVGSYQGAFLCSLVIDDQLKYLSPRLALVDVSARLVAHEIAARMELLKLGIARNIKFGRAFDDTVEGKSRPCDNLAGELIIAFSTTLMDKLPYVDDMTNRVRAGRARQPQLKLWDNMLPGGA